MQGNDFIKVAFRPVRPTGMGECVCGHCPPPSSISRLRFGWDGLKQPQLGEWEGVLKDFDPALAVAHDWLYGHHVLRYLAGVMSEIAGRPAIKAVARHYSFRPRCDGSALVASLRAWPSKDCSPNHYVAQFDFTEREGVVRSYVMTLGKAFLALARGIRRDGSKRTLDFIRVDPVFDDEDVLVQYEDDLHYWVKGVTYLTTAKLVKCDQVAPNGCPRGAACTIQYCPYEHPPNKESIDLRAWNGVQWRSGRPLVVSAGMIGKSVHPQTIHMDFPGRLVRGGTRHPCAQFFYDLAKDETIPMAIRHRLAGEFGYSPFNPEFDAAWTEFKNAWRTADDLPGHYPPDYRDFDNTARTRRANSQ